MVVIFSVILYFRLRGIHNCNDLSAAERLKSSLYWSSFACTYLHTDGFMYCMAHQVMAVVVETHFCKRTNGQPRHVYLVYFYPHNSEYISFQGVFLHFCKIPLFTPQVCEGIQVPLTHWVYIVLFDLVGWPLCFQWVRPSEEGIPRIGFSQLAITSWRPLIWYCLILGPYPTHYHRQQR